jgi:hypothetical protein
LIPATAWRSAWGGATKPFTGADEIGLKPRRGLMVLDQPMESLMWDIMISLIYRRSCRNYRAAARKQLWT